MLAGIIALEDAIDMSADSPVREPVAYLAVGGADTQHGDDEEAADDAVTQETLRSPGAL